MKMKASKGTIQITTFSSIHIRKAFPFDGFEKDAVLADLNQAAINSNFLDSNNEVMTFKYLGLTQENSYGNIIKDMSFAFNNFPGIHFTMSFSKDEAERNKFRSWTKFWTELTKIGYKVK